MTRIMKIGVAAGLTVALGLGRGGGVGEGAALVNPARPVVQADAGLTASVALWPAQALEGADEGGQPLFAAPERARFLVEVDIRGAKGNKNGFGAEEFIPYLSVTYALRPTAGGETVRGPLYPFVGRRGLRYGNNIMVPAPGPYVLTLTLEPPSKVGFGRHTDLETGVGRWWPPMQMEWTVDPAKAGTP